MTWLGEERKPFPPKKCTACNSEDLTGTYKREFSKQVEILHIFLHMCWNTSVKGSLQVTHFLGKMEEKMMDGKTAQGR